MYNEAIFNQGLANLRLEGRFLSDQQKQIARDFQEGRTTKDEFLKLAIEYAKNRN